MRHRRPSPTRVRPRVEVGDIFRAHGEVYRQRHVLTPDQSKVLRAVEVCRTEVLGGHLDVCDSCGYTAPSYNSCRDRHCPKCQSLAQARWLEQRLERLLPVHYFHVVFTLPAALRPVARRNQRTVYKLLFEAASSTLLRLGEDPARLGAQLGLTAILHTWTRQLEYHPHLHCVVTGGGLSLDGPRWVAARTKFLFPVHVMSPLFRGVFLDGLRRAHEKGELSVVGTDFQKLLDGLYAQDWVVYAKRPFGGPESVFQYLGRYTHRVGISNQRLLSLDERGVTFYTKDGKTATVTPEEFIRRFLLHVLPPGFVKIRHYGLWSASNATTRLEVARRLLEGGTTETASASPAPSAPPPPPSTPEPEPIVEELNWQRRLLLLAGIDVTRCPRCQVGRMQRQPLHSPAPSPPGLDTS